MATPDDAQDLPAGFPGFGWSEVARERAQGLPPRSDIVGFSGTDDDGEDDSRWVLDTVRRASGQFSEASGAAARSRTSRDKAIRLALRLGVSYRQVGEASGLSRPMLDRIRRAQD